MHFSRIDGAWVGGRIRLVDQVAKGAAKPRSGTGITTILASGAMKAE
ncbi:hypothetical protein KYC_09210 [Achromobacter arsenitoxydans SY8]|uniref:Uncharacterized protein n=1 Tax=Achromobacter arsenitoxydans SY8 TaxID=477184 RepID=H0F500_9BURK|nr:hypothetical protein KYC_09210 [Achromobacter arsenitoxydans SY8]